MFMAVFVRVQLKSGRDGIWIILSRRRYCNRRLHWQDLQQFYLHLCPIFFLVSFLLVHHPISPKNHHTKSYDLAFDRPRRSLDQCILLGHHSREFPEDSTNATWMVILRCDGLV